MFFFLFDEIPGIRISAALGPRRLLGGGAYLIFCPKSGGYSRAPLTEINKVSPGQLHATPKKKTSSFNSPAG